MKRPNRSQFQNIFYVYEHWRPDKNVPFWVGKGHSDRAYIFRRNLHYNNIVAKLARFGMCVEVRMVENGLPEHEAFALETVRIHYWRSKGIKLTNQSDGGEGLANPSEEIRIKMRYRAPDFGLKCRQRILDRTTPEQRRESMRKASLVHAALIKSDSEYREAARKRMIENITPELRRDMGKRRKGKNNKWTDESRKSFREKRVGYEVSEQTRALIRAEILGRRWITNGSHERQVDPQEPLAAGWYYGRIVSFRWITNRVETKAIKPGEALPLGWKYGTTILRQPWITDGDKEAKLPVNGVLPSGWIFGRKKRPPEKVS